MTRVLAVVCVLVAGSALADEGMWTFDNFPSAQVKQKFGFEPTQPWLDHVRLSSARLAAGCSASFVSPQGLVMTNHHCARGCIRDLSTAKQDLIQNGFYAKTLAQERQCPAMEVNKLLEITDVTAQVHGATRGLEGEKFKDAHQAVLARIEQACNKGNQIRCDVVSLYAGGRYHLYRYARFQDVRLVFAPEDRIASFGGDPDNFEFPRYTFDVTFLRVYDGGKPVKLDHHFEWSKSGAAPGELTFTSGNPWRTSRLDPISKLEYQRDVSLPERLFALSELRGIITEFGRRGQEQARVTSSLKLSLENSLKALRGRREALVDQAFFAQKVAEQRALQDKVNADPAKKKAYGDAWNQIATAMRRLRTFDKELRALETDAGARSTLFKIARQLHRAAEERPKPNEQRLPEFSEAKLPSLTQSLFSTAPISPELETTLLTFYLTRLREELGTTHPAVVAALGDESPEALAKKVIRGTRLRDVAVRKRLFEGGAKAIAASKDPLLALVARLDPASRAVRQRYEDEVEAVVKKNEELIARARFEAYGTSQYPDATASPRLSFGSVQGYSEGGRVIPPMTTIGGTFEHATGNDPFRLPPSWLRAKSKLEASTPMNLVTTNDIIGGNSGSPLINKNAEIVGLIFDSNRQALRGEYGFDLTADRAISVHSSAIIEALDEVYDARRLLQELQPKAEAAPENGSR